MPNPSSEMEWTVLVFLNADNDLEEFGIRDMNEMEMVGSTPNMNVVVQIDRMPGLDTSNGDWTDTRRYFIRKDSNTSTISSTLLETIGEADMGDPETLREFVQWGQQAYPAKRYCVVVWNHGSGWRALQRAQSQAEEDVLTKAVSFDETNGTHIRTIDLPSALSTGTRLDLVAFDASLMQMTEVLYEMRDMAEVVVGSEESPPGDGYPYHRWLARLSSSPTMLAPALGSIIVNEYVEFYSGRSSVTQSAISTGELPGLAAAVDNLAVALMPHRSSSASALASARDTCQSYAFSDYKDLLDYVQQVTSRIDDSALRAAGASVTTALNRAVIAEANTGSSVQRSNGLSVWIPDADDYRARSASYSQLQFSLDTRWDEWLAGQTL